MTYRILNLLHVTVLLFVLQIFPPVNALAEIIYLKDGSVLKGNIIREEKTRITVKTENGEKILKLKDTRRILYGNSEMERIFIITNSGNAVKGYMIDQDDDRIILREDPDSPEEKTILKKNIRQISRTEIYPTDLEFFVKPSWLMPLDSGGAQLKGSVLYTAGMGFTSMFGMNFRFLLEAGFTRLPGESCNDRYLQVIPVTLSLTYRLGNMNFGFYPKIGAGIALMEFDTAENRKLSTRSADVLAGAGIIYGLTDNISLGLWGEYDLFFDRAGYLQCALIGLSVSYRI